MIYEKYTLVIASDGIMKFSSGSQAIQRLLAAVLLFIAEWRVQSKLGSLGKSAIYWPIVPAPGDYEDGEFLME
jgi:hypothetical protein